MWSNLVTNFSKRFFLRQIDLLIFRAIWTIKDDLLCGCYSIWLQMVRLQRNRRDEHTPFVVQWAFERGTDAKASRFPSHICGRRPIAFYRRTPTLQSGKYVVIPSKQYSLTMPMQNKARSGRGDRIFRLNTIIWPKGKLKIKQITLTEVHNAICKYTPGQPPAANPASTREGSRLSVR